MSMKSKGILLAAALALSPRAVSLRSTSDDSERAARSDSAGSQACESAE